MLESLKINNFVLIPSLDLELNEGMTVLTGETGSGKSIVLGALSLILGAKADKDEIRAGEEKAELEAVFRTDRKALLRLLEDKGIDAEDGQIIIRRQIRANGRSIYSVNGSGITLSEGQEIGRMLVDITSQNSSIGLMRKDNQRRMLDSSKDILSSLADYSCSYEKLIALEKEKTLLEQRISRWEEDRVYMEYSLNELEGADLIAGEDDEIHIILISVCDAEIMTHAVDSGPLCPVARDPVLTQQDGKVAHGIKPDCKRGSDSPKSKQPDFHFLLPGLSSGPELISTTEASSSTSG